MMRKLIISLILMLGINVSVFGQAKFKNRYAVGINYNPEWRIDKEAMDRKGGIHRYNHVFGVSGEAQFSKHSGMELFVGYRQFNENKILLAALPEVDPPHNYEQLRMVSLKLGYKFYSDIVNVKLGVSADFYTEGENPMNLVGGFISISKDITLYKGLILEPEVHVNPTSHSHKHRTFLGGGVKLKYRF